MLYIYIELDRDYIYSCYREYIHVCTYIEMYLDALLLYMYASLSNHQIEEMHTTRRDAYDSYGLMGRVTAAAGVHRIHTWGGPDAGEIRTHRLQIIAG